MSMRILALIIFFLGALAFYTAKFTARWLNLAEKQKIVHEDEMTAEEIEEAKERGAILKAKLLSMILMLPGIVLILIYFR